MTTPNLIVQHRELARSLREIRRQKEQSLDAIAAARDREIVASEQARLAANRQYDARLAEFLEPELIARSKVKFLSEQAFDKVDETAPLMPIENPEQTLGECVSEIERVLAKLACPYVLLKFTTIPSDVNRDAVVKKIKAITGRDFSSYQPTQGKSLGISLNHAHKVIEEMKAFDIKVEIES